MTANDVLLLDDIGETILPVSADLAGAKAAAIGVYMLTTLNDCYSVKDKATFIEGLDSLEAACIQQHQTTFGALTSLQKIRLLTQLDAETQNTSGHYFSMLKKLSIYGYVTSEIGATKALRYEAVPGIFRNIPYKKGDKRWATV